MDIADGLSKFLANLSEHFKAIFFIRSPVTDDLQLNFAVQKDQQSSDTFHILHSLVGIELFADIVATLQVD